MVTHNGLALTRQAVRSVLQHTVWPAFDLVVVDNGSTDGTADDLQQLTREEARVKVILQERNEGFARASNRGIRESEGEYVVLLNNDTVVTRGWLGRLIRHLERNRDAAMAGPLTNSCGNEARIAVSYRDGRERDAFAAALARENDGRSFDVSMLALFCTVIRREALREVGLLDERFEVGMFEDDDLARRFRDRKYRLLCARDTFVHHEGRGTFARMADREYVRLFEANRKKFEDKWGTLWENQALRQRLPDEERIPLLRRDLRWILNRHPDRRGVMVYPPTIDWSIDLFQRPQQLAIGLSAAGYLFIFCTPTPGTDNLAGFRYLGPNLYAYHGPLEIFDEMPAPIVWISRADLRRHLRHFSRPWVVYDWIDDLSVFHAYYPRMTRPHRALLRTADLCLATATRLADEARKRRPDVRLCPNAADYDLFARAQNRSAAPIPEELKPLTGTGRPIVGYFGALAGWLDYDLIRHVAECRPEWQLLLIGPDHDGTLPREQLAPLSNVTWLGARKYQTIPRYLAWFDVAWIPFHVNRITLATSPIKLFEYMAGGKPIVAADLPECRKYSPVLVARTHAAFVSQLDRAMTLRHDARYLAELDAVARQNSWQARVEEITALLPDAKRAGGRPTP